MQADWIIHNAREVVTLAGPSKPRSGQAQSELGLIEHGAIALQGDRILAVGSESEILRDFRASRERTLDAHGGVILPGFVDPHTHLLFAGSRAHEFAMRRAGKSYMEIAAAGGGIRSSVRAFRQASDEEILEQSRRRMDRMLQFGTTTAEVKSGYGLDSEQELRALRLIAKLNRIHPMDLIATFMGAHEVPDEYRDNRAAYLEQIVEEMLPRVAAETEARFCDVFCEQGVFDRDETATILRAASRLGLGLKVHADEFVPIGGSELAGEMKAVSADHLLVATESGMKALRDGGVIAVLLPGTCFSLGTHDYADGRKMIEMGIPVALGTDCNPGSSMIDSMPLILALACLEIGLSPAETIVASTVNAAFAAGVGEDRGRLEPGLRADLQVLDAETYVSLVYHLGGSHVRWVFKDGERVYSR
jgi:imidazolonepropionase